MPQGHDNKLELTEPADLGELDSLILGFVPTKVIVRDSPISSGVSELLLLLVAKLKPPPERASSSCPRRGSAKTCKSRRVARLANLYAECFIPEA